MARETLRSPGCERMRSVTADSTNDLELAAPVPPRHSPGTTNPPGDSKLRMGGRMHVRWDEGAAATPHGQLVFFAEFLAATGVFERWVSQCPLVAAQALGMNKVVSEDALRWALERIDEAASTAWMRPALMHSVREALDKPWVLDIDASIKPLYGRQEGAELGYNPAKPKRPSHVLHTFWVDNLRLVLDVQGCPVHS